MAPQPQRPLKQHGPQRAPDTSAATPENGARIADKSAPQRRSSPLADAEEAGEEIAADIARPLDPFRPPENAVRRGITVHISGRTIALVFTVIIAISLLEAISTVIIMFAGAVLLAAAVDLPASWLERHRVPRSIAVLAINLLIFGALAAVVYQLIPLVTSEIQALSKNLPRYTTDVEDFINRHRSVSGSQSGTSKISLSSATEKISSNLGAVAASLTDFTVTFGRDAILVLAMFVAAYFFAMDPQIGTRFMRRFLSPPTQERMHSITHNIHQRIGGWVQGQVMIAVTFGALFGIGLWAIRVPHAFSLGLAAAVLEIVPYLGGAVTLVLGVLVALGVGLPHVIGVIILYTVLVNVESHVLAPTFYGRAVGMPPVAILAALVIGLEIRGIAGVFLAVPASLVIYAILDEFWPTPEELNPDGTPKKKEPPPPGWLKRAAMSIANRIRSA